MNRVRRHHDSTVNRAKAQHDSRATMPTPRSLLWTRFSDLRRATRRTGAIPEYADQSIRIPEWECYGKTNIADREYRKRIRHRPKSARQKRPDNQVFFPHEVGHDVASALEQSRKSPPCGKNPGDHAE